MKASSLFRNAAVVVATALIAGCASNAPSGASTAATATNATTATAPAPQDTCPPEANLLRDAEFATLAGGPERVWGMRQHSRGRDFRATAKAGVLTIEKTGHEPWFVMSQRIERQFPPGTELQYDALISMDTHEPKDPHGFGYLSGLHLVGKSGRRSVVRAMADHEPNLGQHPEQRVVTRVSAEAAINRIDAGFIHQAGGSFTVREPRLVNLNRYPQCRLP